MPEDVNIHTAPPIVKGLEVKDGKEQATKHDGDKPRFSLIPKRALTEVAKVFTFGAKKYDVGNWHSGVGFDYDRLSSAAERHEVAFELGEDYDPESTLHHLAHKICCDMMQLEAILAGKGVDNRNRSQLINDPNFVPNPGGTDAK